MQKLAAVRNMAFDEGPCEYSHVPVAVVCN